LLPLVQNASRDARGGNLPPGLTSDLCRPHPAFPRRRGKELQNPARLRWAFPQAPVGFADTLFGKGAFLLRGFALSREAKTSQFAALTTTYALISDL